jgi:hypothetical protein
MTPAARKKQAGATDEHRSRLAEEGGIGTEKELA